MYYLAINSSTMANGDIIHTVVPSGECNLSVDVGDRRTERQTDRQISSPFTSALCGLNAKMRLQSCLRIIWNWSLHGWLHSCRPNPSLFPLRRI